MLGISRRFVGQLSRARGCRWLRLKVFIGDLRV